MTTISLVNQETAAVTTRPPLAHTVWQVAVQLVVVGLTAVALLWAPVPTPVQRKLWELLAIGMLLVTAVAPWRRSAMPGVLAGITLALACWGTTAVTWTIGEQSPLAQFAPYLPKMMPIVLAAAVVLAVWGALARAGLRDPAHFGVSAVGGGVLIALFATAFFLIVNYSPVFNTLYAIEGYQLAALLFSLGLYAPAIWLGTVGVRATSRWSLLPLGMTLVLGGFLYYWRYAATLRH